MQQILVHAACLKQCSSHLVHVDVFNKHAAVQPSTGQEPTTLAA